METIYLVEGETLTGLANAVRAKTGVSGAMTPAVIGETFENWEVSDKSVELIEGTLTSYENNSMTSLNSYAFYRCSFITSVNFPACTIVGSSAFYSCSNLTFVNLPACTNVRQRAFYNCSNLSAINIDACTVVGSSAFYSCSNLTSINLPFCTYISSFAFACCNKLESIYLSGSSICRLMNTSAFNATPMSNSSYIGKFGSIYVPASLVSSYKASTNWVKYSNRITSII